MAEHEQQFTDPALERALRAVGTEIAYPPTPDLAATIRQRIAAQPARSRPWWSSPIARRLTVALALLLIIAVILGAIPPVRKGIARRLGLSNVEIVNVTAVPTTVPRAPTALPTTNLPVTATPGAAAPTATSSLTSNLSGAALGTATTLAEAQSRAPFAVQTPSLPEYRVPDAVYRQEPPPGGRVSLVYASRPDLPAIPGTTIGLLLQEFKGGIQAGLFQKGVPSGSRVEPVTINGVAGYWIEGGLRYFGYTDASGVMQFEESRIAGNTLLWERDGIVYRLESSLPKNAAVQIAESVR